MQPENRDSGYVWDMREFAREASALVADKKRSAFESDRTLQLAVLHLVQMFGEAAAHVSESFRAVNPQVPWRDIVGMRHVIVHGYRDVDASEIWVVATRDLPTLVAELEGLIPTDDLTT